MVDSQQLFMQLVFFVVLTYDQLSNIK